MKIVLFTHSLASGGAERVAVNLANHWAGQNCDVSIITLAAISEDFYTSLHPNIQRIALNLTQDSSNSLVAIKHNLQRLIALRNVLQHIKPDVALALMDTSNILLALAALGIKELTTIGSEHIYPPKLIQNQFWQLLRRYSYRFLDCVVALTSESAVWLKQHTHAHKVAVIANPITFPLKNQEPILPTESIINPKRKIVLAVGRLHAQKQLGLLIDIFADLAPNNPTWDLVILGEGQLREELQQQILHLQLSERVLLPGRAGNMHDWYQAAEIYALSSAFEGFPNTLLEAMAYGLACVSFDCDTGPRDMIEHGHNGLLVAADDRTIFTNTLQQLMNDPALRSALGQQAQKVRQTFSITNIMQQWQAVISNDIC